MTTPLGTSRWTRMAPALVVMAWFSSRCCLAEPKRGEIERHAVVVGVADYQASPAVPGLLYADRDATTFYDFLVGPRGWAFPRPNVVLLTNHDATASNLKRAVERTVARAKANDWIVVFLSGYGIRLPSHGDAGYFCTYETNPRDLARTAYPMAHLRDQLRTKCRASQVVILADACRRPPVVIGERLVPPAWENRFGEDLANLVSARQGVYVLSSARPGTGSKESREHGGGRGIFTFYVLDAVNERSDRNKDGVIALDELAAHVTRSIRLVTQGEQNPVLWGRSARPIPVAVTGIEKLRDMNDLIARRLGARPYVRAPAEVESAAFARARFPKSVVELPKLFINPKTSDEKGFNAALVLYKAGRTETALRDIREIAKGTSNVARRAAFLLLVDALSQRDVPAAERFKQQLVLRNAESDEAAEAIRRLDAVRDAIDAARLRAVADLSWKTGDPGRQIHLANFAAAYPLSRRIGLARQLLDTMEVPPPPKARPVPLAREARTLERQAVPRPVEKSKRPAPRETVRPAAGPSPRATPTETAKSSRYEAAQKQAARRVRDRQKITVWRNFLAKYPDDPRKADAKREVGRLIGRIRDRCESDCRKLLAEAQKEFTAKKYPDALIPAHRVTYVIKQAERDTGQAVGEEWVASARALIRQIENARRPGRALPRTPLKPKTPEPTRPVVIEKRVAPPSTPPPKPKIVTPTRTAITKAPALPSPPRPAPVTRPAVKPRPVAPAPKRPAAPLPTAPAPPPARPRPEATRAAVLVEYSNAVVKANQRQRKGDYEGALKAALKARDILDKAEDQSQARLWGDYTTSLIDKLERQREAARKAKASQPSRSKARIAPTTPPRPAAPERMRVEEVLVDRNEAKKLGARPAPSPPPAPSKVRSNSEVARLRQYYAKRYGACMRRARDHIARRDYAKAETAVKEAQKLLEEAEAKHHLQISDSIKREIRYLVEEIGLERSAVSDK